MKFRYLYMLILAFIINKVGAQSTASKQVTKFEIASPQLNALKTIWVYLPSDYKNSKKSYPVLYMHDAQNLFDIATAYAGEWEIDEYMDSLLVNKSIIIGIEHGNEKRIDELTPYEHKKHGGGQGEAYVSFIKHTLKPHVDVAYRTKSEAKNTTIMGSSLGGLISFYATIKYPKTFGNAGVFSPAFWINPEIFDLVNTTDIPESSKFYFVAGTDEGETMLPKLEEMISLLKSKGVKTTQFEFHSIGGGQHNEEFWAQQFGEGYQYLIINN
ncbi:alpha/beta hydrolase [Winogradskyella bathintestinalis]|uniref:Alpha/beta hydrolase-fold protein n=1 Tax=Winogradskyella bathintestinalis TaxID=3035208 RepID=A0ABT7ZWV8_9FLAO|nr:alpha/beta hydrolase-fold protein [Winogradskyella bathintestinalis]MDN3493462.1 alpha/beta hydrolase-fold protein [Winogradskyella bathintestinalis]